jgi:transcriptional regulator with XRE-family HTH domain
MDDIESFNKKEFLLRLGERIKKVRKSNGYSQDRACLEAGLSRGALSKIERGLVEPKISTLAIIALVLDVQLKSLTDVKLE